MRRRNKNCHHKVQKKMWIQMKWEKKASKNGDKEKERDEG